MRLGSSTLPCTVAIDLSANIAPAAVPVFITVQLVGGACMVPNRRAQSDADGAAAKAGPAHWMRAVFDGAQLTSVRDEDRVWAVARRALP